MRRALLTATLALGIVAFQSLSAYADFVPVPQLDPSHPNDDWTGLRSTPQGSGVIAADGWTDARGGFRISWTIVPEAGNLRYTYTISNADGSIPTTPGLSHWVLEVSPIMTEQNLSQFIFSSTVPIKDGPQLWSADPTPDPTDPGHNNGNPNLPADLYGIEFDLCRNSPYTFSFLSTQIPVWGDFYAKDGAPGNEGHIVATAWDSGIGTDPTLLTTDFSLWIPVPDTFSGGGGQIPEPSSLLLLTLGGCGVLASRLRRKP